MNIFFLSSDIEESCTFHCDRHVVCQVKEYVQMLSTAHRVLDGQEQYVLSAAGRRIKAFKMPSILDDELMNKATHYNHPSAIWARSNRSCYEYLHKLTVALCEEHTHRYGTIRSCITSGLLDRLAAPPENISIGEFTEPTPAMPSEFIVPSDSVESYRRYYVGAKRHLASWKNREQPYWYK